MNELTLQGHILTPGGFIHGQLVTQDGHIKRIDGRAVDEARARAGDEPLYVPGFIDLHVHGGAGVDTMQAGQAVAEMSRLHARHGTTALLATTMTAPMSEIVRAFEAAAAAIGQRPVGAAHVLGMHLEGPFLSAQRLGAQPDFARAGSLDDVQTLHAIAPIRLITLAPEVPSHMDLIEALVAQGFVVQLGHSNASYEDGVEALSRGAQGFTHLFNAMSPLHHRAPGLVGAALAHAQHAEIIPDLLHVHAGALRAAWRAIPQLHCVTDATAAAGMPDGRYPLGRQMVHKCLGGVRLADGTLAGSTLTMDQALRNLVHTLALPLQEAVRLVSTHAADFIGETSRGRLQAGACADIVQLDADLQVQQVWVHAQPILAAPGQEPGA